MFQARAGFDDFARSFHAGAMPGDARQMAALRPAAIAVHDDGEMLGQTLRVEFFEKFRFSSLAGFRSSTAFTRIRSGLSEWINWRGRMARK